MMTRLKPPAKIADRCDAPQCDNAAYHRVGEQALCHTHASKAATRGRWFPHRRMQLSRRRRFGN